MKRIALACVLIAGCSKEKEGEIPIAVDGEKFDEASLIEKGKVTILDFGADW